jgi:hypothetical protein
MKCEARIWLPIIIISVLQRRSSKHTNHILGALPQCARYITKQQQAAAKILYKVSFK